VAERIRATGENRAEPARVWCIGDWAKVNPQSAEVYGVDRSAMDDLVRRNSVWDGGTATVFLQGAQNEFLSFQIVIESLGEPVRGIFVAAQDLDGPVRLDSARSVELFRESFIPTNGRFYPDRLLPLDLSGVAPFSIPEMDAGIPGQKVAVVWVDIYVPHRTPAGRYESTFKISYKGTMRLAEFTVQLDVLDFALPDQLGLNVELLNYPENDPAQGFSGVAIASPRHWEIDLAFHRMAHRHRTTYCVLPYAQNGVMLKGYAPSLRGKGDRVRVTNWMEWDPRFGPLLDGTAFSNLPRAGVPVTHFILPLGLEYPAAFRHWGSDRYKAENRALAEEFIFHIAQRGWIGPSYFVYYSSRERHGFFPWNLDGPTESDDVEALRSLSVMLRSSLHGHPGINAGLRVDFSHFHCSNHKGVVSNIEQGLIGYLDLWNIQNSHWTQSTAQVIDDIRKKEDLRVWFYIRPAGAEETSGSIRDLPWLAWRRRVQGLCFRDPPGRLYDDLDDVSLQPLMYSGADCGVDGPLSSIRLKVLRRGLQEYELLSMIADRQGMDAADRLVDRILPSTAPLDWDKQREEMLGLLSS